MSRKRTLVAGLIVVVALASGLCYAISYARHAAKLSSSHGHLFKLALALLEYQERHGHLPAAATGLPPHSWRVAILPNFFEPALYQRYDLSSPWNSPANLAVAADDIQKIYCWPDPSKHGTASYLAVIGPNTLWPAQGDMRVDESSDRILLVEWPESTISWTEPKDLTVAEVEALLAAGHELRYITMSRELGVLTANSPRPW